MSAPPAAWNLIETARGSLAGEIFDTITSGSEFELGRIVSFGHHAPETGWFDQEKAEWVLLLAGSAGLAFEDETTERTLRPGDAMFIAPHRRHRVTWTEPGVATVWLALHFTPEEAS